MLPVHLFIPCPPQPRMPLQFLAALSLSSPSEASPPSSQPGGSPPPPGSPPSISLLGESCRGDRLRPQSRDCTSLASGLGHASVSSALALVQTITSHWDTSYRLSHTGLLSAFPAHPAASAPGPLHLLARLPEVQCLSQWLLLMLCLG